MRMEFLWLALIVVFAVIEGATTALTTVWFIGGALAALAAALLHAELWLQITLFFAVSVVLLAALRPLVKKYLRPRTVRTNAAGNIGREAIVTEAIDNLHETGAVRLSGVEWTARSADGSPVAAGTVVRIDAIEGVKLIVTVDCGITAVSEAELCKQLGIDLVITDHHECKEELPRALAVVDPHRSDCPYPFKHLAGVGVALKLVLALGGESREDALFARYCTLAAIGTIADVMRMEGENRTIAFCGLEALPHTDFVGVHALLKEAGLLGKPITSVQIGFVLAPRINAAGRMGAADLAADLLETDDPARAEELAKALCDLNRERQAVEQAICADATEKIERLRAEDRSALVLSSEDWHQGVVGIVASRLSEKYACPSFMIHLKDGVGKGSCRSYGGFNLFSALESCADLLEGFGGHELAAGFTISEENIAAFRARMNRYVRSASGGERAVSCLDVDAPISCPGEVTLAEVEQLD